jgi:hypothetical protein
MSVLPPSPRLPARKHVLAGVFGVLGLGLMVMAVLTASGLATPFSSDGPEGVSTDAVLVNAPEETTTTTATASTSSPAVNRAVAAAPFSAPATTAPPTTSQPRTPGPTTTTLVPPTTVPPTTIPGLLDGLGQGLSGR